MQQGEKRMPASEPPVGEDALDRLSFKVCAASRVTAGSGNEWPFRERLTTNRHLLLVATAGEWRLTADGHIFHILKGTAFIGAPGQYIALDRESADAEAGLFLFEAGSDRSASGFRAEEPPRLPVEGEVSLDSLDADASSLCDAIDREWRSEDPLDRLHGRIVFQELLYHVLREARLRRSGELEQSLERAKRYLDEHLAEPVNVEKLAALTGVSYRHFMRLFRRQYGQSVVDYMTGLRMADAKRLLADGHVPVKEAARRTGFADELYFRRRFKQQVGMPPAVYMRNRRLRIAAYSYYNLGQLLPLGIIPHAAPLDHWWTDHYRLKYESDVSVRLAHDYDFNREALRHAGMERIVGLGDYVSAEEQERLRQIAPALFVRWSDRDWRDHLREVAQFVSKEAEAESWLDGYARKAQKVRQLAEARFRAETVMLLRFTADGMYAYGQRNAGAVLYGDLRLACPDRLAAEELPQRLTPEELAAVDPEHMFLIAGRRQAADSFRDTLLRSELWRGLKAVRNRRLYPIADDPWVEYTAYNHARILDELSKMLGRRGR